MDAKCCCAVLVDSIQNLSGTRKQGESWGDDGGRMTADGGRRTDDGGRRTTDG